MLLKHVISKYIEHSISFPWTFFFHTLNIGILRECMFVCLWLRIPSKSFIFLFILPPPSHSLSLSLPIFIICFSFASVSPFHLRPFWVAAAAAVAVAAVAVGRREARRFFFSLLFFPFCFSFSTMFGFSRLSTLARRRVSRSSFRNIKKKHHKTRYIGMQTVYSLFPIFHFQNIIPHSLRNISVISSCHLNFSIQMQLSCYARISLLF